MVVDSGKSHLSFCYGGLVGERGVHPESVKYPAQVLLGG
jgi:hypothetical protein